MASEDPDAIDPWQEADGPPPGDTAPQPSVPPASPPPAGPSGTAVMPPVEGAGTEEPPGGPRWAGRAAVPTPAVPAPNEEYVQTPPRSTLVPVLITVCVMLLLGVLGLGAWLILSDQPSPAPSPSGRPAPTTGSATPTPTTTTSPTPSPSPVAVPDLAGGTWEEAEQALVALGLSPVRADEHNDAAAGTVIRTEPAQGTLVPPGGSVVVFVSLGPEPSPSPSPSPSPTGT